MNKKFLLFVLGGCLSMASCSDSKNKAAEASKAALESMESNESGTEQNCVVTADTVQALLVPEEETEVQPAVAEQVEPVQEPEVEAVEKVPEVVEEVVQNVDNGQTVGEASGTSSADPSSLSEKMGFVVSSDDDLELFEEVASWLGAPYLAAGNDKSGVDCSGFICKVYEKLYSKKLPRRSTDMYDQCEAISVNSAKAGDLVFFRPDGKMDEKPNYVGIYLKDNSFVIVSSSKGVTIADLSSNYYKKTFVTAAKVKY